jgi:NADPH-dependent 2,4-dienoyl-CoA reductase/sulfur reductase-like enzyme
MDRVDLLIIGAGAAGMAAALAAVDYGVESILLAERGETLGGILPQCLHQGFGLSYFGENLTGREYAARFVRRVENSPVQVMLNTMVLEISTERTAVLCHQGGLRVICFERAVMATGCRERPLGTLPVFGSRPSGIFTAGQAQKMINIAGYDIGDEIVILGSGDLGLVMARQLALSGKSIVALIEQKPHLGGLLSHQQALAGLRIPVIKPATIEQVHGSGRINAVSIRCMNNGRGRVLPCSSLIVSVGLIPERELAEPVISDGEAPPWLALCGNCDYVHRIVDTVSQQAESVIAGLFGKEGQLI